MLDNSVTVVVWIFGTMDRRTFEHGSHALWSTSPTAIADFDEMGSVRVNRAYEECWLRGIISIEDPG